MPERAVSFSEHACGQSQFRTAEVADAPALVKQFGTMQFQPEHISVSYHDGAVGDWRVLKIEVWGRRVVRGGLSDRSTASNTYSANGAYPLTNAPDWAREFAEQHMPTTGME